MRRGFGSRQRLVVLSLGLAGTGPSSGASVAERVAFEGSEPFHPRALRLVTGGQPQRPCTKNPNSTLQGSLLQCRAGRLTRAFGFKFVCMRFAPAPGLGLSRRSRAKEGARGGAAGPGDAAGLRRVRRPALLRDAGRPPRRPLGPCPARHCPRCAWNCLLVLSQ